MAHADIIVPTVDNAKGPMVRLTRDDGTELDLTLEEAWGRVEDSQGVGTRRGECLCEPCALFSVVRHLR